MVELSQKIVVIRSVCHRPRAPKILSVELEHRQSRVETQLSHKVNLIQPGFSKKMKNTIK